MVKRMDVIATVDETHWGEDVEYTDYAALEAENTRLKEALREAESNVDFLLDIASRTPERFARGDVESIAESPCENP